MAELEVHEIATLFPSMSQVDLDQLRESIGAQGQLEEILVFEGKILDGRHRYQACLALGVEPRLREFQGTAQEAFAYSVALNLSRRHLTTVQRAAAGAGIKEFQARLLAATAAPATTAAPAEPAAAEPTAADEATGSPADAPSTAPSDEPTEADATPAPAPEISVAIDERPAEAEASAPRISPRINARAREIASQRVGVSGRAIDTAAKIKQEAPDVFERMLAGTAGSLPDAKRVTALPPDVREKVHALVDEGKQLKAALREVTPAPAREEGAVFVGKVVLEPEQARDFEAIVEARGLKRADAAREALLDWVSRHRSALVQGASGDGAPAEEPAELVGAS